MSPRPPGGGKPSVIQTGVGVLDYELAGEMAASLGRAGRRVEEALARLDAEGDDPYRRPALLKEAAHAVHAYFIQRELCGLKRHDSAIRDYGIPPAVLVRLGAK